MGLQYNADELFEIAERIEKNGAEFYRHAAANTSDQSGKELLESLAAWEDQHERLFASMRSELSEEARESVLIDRDDQAAMYLQAAADTHVFNVNEISDLLEGDETPMEILQIALGFEKDSIVFFLAMSELVPESLGRSKVEKIVHEELNHVAVITKHIKELEDEE